VTDDSNGRGGFAGAQDAFSAESPAEAAYAAALAWLPGAGPRALVAILREWSPEEAWRRIRDGRLRRPRLRRGTGAAQPGFDLADVCTGPEPMASVAMPNDSRVDESWQEAARRIAPPTWWARHAGHRVGVTWIGQPDYPEALVDDPEPPGVLFWSGCLHHLKRPCVAVVGTRRATPDGLSVAFELGRDLAAAGICVVSGLAIGIDGAAHAGAVSVAPGCELGPSSEAAGWPGHDHHGAGPAGVAASGVDVPYPRCHARLWKRVTDAGVMLSETLPGRPAQAWRFPARNRIIAGLVSMVVVVESHATGGSLITAEAALVRGVDVRVVPGPVHSAASAGSNQLLYDGPGPVRNARDVLDGLGIFQSQPVSIRRDQHAHARRSSTAMPKGPPWGPTESRLEHGAERVLDAVSWRPTSLNQLVARTGFSIAATSRFLDELEARGAVACDGQWWVRRSGCGPSPSAGGGT
jgi:DNA processing protein